MNTTTTTIKKAEALGYRLRIEDGYVTVAQLDRESFTAEVHKGFRSPWGVGTTSYGTLSPEDIDMVIDGLKRGQALVKLLNDAGL